MKELNARVCQNTTIKEVNNHIEQKHWELIPREQVLKGEQLLPYIWEFKQNMYIKTKLVFKHKTCLDLYGGKQEYVSNFCEAF